MKQKNENAPSDVFTNCFKLHFPHWPGYNRPLGELMQIKGTIQHINIWLSLSLKCHPFGPAELPVREAHSKQGDPSQ